MRATAKALKRFVGGFGLPAYMKGSVPDNITVPYLVYPLTEPEWNQKATFYIQGWYRSTDLTALTEKADQIVKEIGVGVTLTTDGGYLVIYPESPLIQIETADDFRYFYINLSINAYQMPGYYPAPTPTPQTAGNDEPGADPEEGD